MKTPPRPLIHSLADTRQHERLAEAADLRRAAVCRPAGGRWSDRPRAALASAVTRCRETVHLGARIGVLVRNRLSSVGKSH